VLVTFDLLQLFTVGAYIMYLQIRKYSHEFLVSSTATKWSKWELPCRYMIQCYTDAPQVNGRCELLATWSPQHCSLIHVGILAFVHTINQASALSHRAN